MYTGVSPGKIDQMLTDGRMPVPRCIDGRKVWDIRDLDLAFDTLPREDPPAEGSWGRPMTLPKLPT